jgi:O-acetyl-ADP-ribose deacetylase (regulator of RNase III)
MKWTICHGDILDVKADVLVCSANPYLNLSGGVGGALLVRYGTALQSVLHEHLKILNQNFVAQGTVVAMDSCGSPYIAILHAVAVDAFYNSSPQIVQDIVVECLIRSAKLGAKTMALPALACGNGRLMISQFGQAIQPILGNSYSPIEEVFIVIRKQDEAEELKAMLTKYKD